jgi:hypothetical protein
MREDKTRQEKSKRAKAHSAIKSSPHHYTQPENQHGS